MGAGAVGAAGAAVTGRVGGLGAEVGAAAVAVPGRAWGLVAEVGAAAVPGRVGRLEGLVAEVGAAEARAWGLVAGVKVSTGRPRGRRRVPCVDGASKPSGMWSLSPARILLGSSMLLVRANSSTVVL